MSKKTLKQKPFGQLTPEAANILIHHLYLLIDEIQFRYCPYEPVIDTDKNKSTNVSGDTPPL